MLAILTGAGAGYCFEADLMAASGAAKDAARQGLQDCIRLGLLEDAAPLGGVGWLPSEAGIAALHGAKGLPA